MSVLNLVCYVSLCEGLRAGTGSLNYIAHIDCCGLSTIVIKNVIIIIIITIKACKMSCCKKFQKFNVEIGLASYTKLTVVLEECTTSLLISTDCDTMTI